jgi:hypothetical protein
MTDAAGRIVRALPRNARRIGFTIDGVPCEAWEGESILVAVLSQRPALRELEFGGEPRAGFCLMGACQDCWVWIGPDRRARACTRSGTRA